MRLKIPLTCSILFLVLVAGCGGPFYAIPGGALDGPVATSIPSDWSSLQDGVMHVETRIDDPYSVEINYVVRNGKLYIDPAEGRAWLDHLRADPKVRVRIDGTVYPMQATLVQDPAEREGFDADRFVYRLEARHTI